MAAVLLTEARIEGLRLQALGRGSCISRSIGAEGRKGRVESSSKGEPEAAKGGKDDGRKAIPEDPFIDASQNHENTAHEEVHGAADLVST